MTFPKVSPQMVVGGALGVIAVAIGVQVISKRDEPSRPPMMITDNDRGQYGRKHKDHDKKKHKDKHDKKKHKHHDDD